MKADFWLGDHFSSAAYSSPIASQNVPLGFSTRCTPAIHCRDQSRYSSAVLLVVVDVVFVADVERRIGKGQIHAIRRHRLHRIDAVELVDRIEFQHEIAAPFQ